MFCKLAASFTVGAVMRTIWQPTSTRSSVCCTQAAVSIVSQVSMDCTTTGWSPPTMTPPCARIANDNFAGFAAVIKIRGLAVTHK